MGKLLLIDGNSIAFRAFYALPPLSNKQGMYTNALFGFTTMLLRILAEQRPTHVLIAFDAGKQTFRHQQYAEYKGGRQKTPPELKEQFPVLKELIDAFGIRQLESDAYEADDIIGSVARLAERDGHEAIVLSGDKDLLQLVSERVQIALTRKGISEIDLYDTPRLHEVYGLTPQQIPDLKGLMGDASDNIPGVPGVGEKTALKLLADFSTVEQVLDNLHQLKGKLRENLQAHADDARVSKQLATIVTDMPLELAIDDLAFTGLQRATTVAMFQRLEFKSLVDKVDALAGAGVQAGASVREGQHSSADPESLEDLESSVSSESSESSESQLLQSLQPLQLTVVRSVADWQQLLAALPNVRAIHVETSGDHPHHAIWQGLALTTADRQFFWQAPRTDEIDFDGADDEPTASCRATLHAWMADATQAKALYDWNRSSVVLGWHDCSVAGVTFDALLAAYLLNPTDTRQGLDELANAFSVDSLPSDEAVYGKGAKFKQPDPQTLAEHAARKARAVMQLQMKMETALREVEMVELVERMELPLASLLARLELTGIKVDGTQLTAFGAQLVEQIARLVETIYVQAGTEFNINSTKQLADILFEKLLLPPGKKTKSGYSTDAEELERLAPHAQIVRDILHYRQLTKLNSTYVEGLLKEIHPRTGKVHTYFNQTTTATGRLSSQYPNLQNIPVRLEEGRLIRKVFVPSEPGWSILAADYSQIELRVLAHISADARLIDAFQRDMDIHTKTAMDVFGVAEHEVDANMRRQAKAVNFGIVYGISDYGLSQNLGISRKQAAAFIEQYFAVFAGVKQYMEDVVKQAKRDGYVVTLLNRRRYLPDIRSSNFNIRSFAERTAMNTPIQGTAADIIKLAMVRLAERMATLQVQSRMLLQVHDELVFEVPADELTLMSQLVRDTMEQALSLAVPLKVDLNVGANWYEAK